MNVKKSINNIRLAVLVMILSMFVGTGVIYADPPQQPQKQEQNTNAKVLKPEEQKAKAKEIYTALENIKNKGDKATEADIKAAKEKGATDSQIDNAKKGNLPKQEDIEKTVAAGESGKESANLFVNTVNQIETELSKSIKKAVTSILGTVSVLLVGIATLQVTLTVLPLVSQKGISQIPQGIFANALKFGFVAWLLQGDNWWNLTQDIKTFFMHAGMKFGDGKFANADKVSTGDIANYIILAPFKVMGFVTDEQINLVWKMMFILTGLLLLIVCIKVLCDFLVAIIEYDLLGGLSGIYIIFLLLDKTQSFGMKAFNHILAGGLKIMLIVAFIGITVQVTEEQAGLLSDGQKPASIFIYCGIVAIMSYMCSIAPAQASSLMTGGGGAATGSGFITSMAKQAVSVVTTTAALAVGGAGIIGALKTAAGAGGGVGGFVKSLGKQAGKKVLNKGKDVIAPFGGAKDAAKAMFSKEGGGVVDRLRNARNAYRNNKGVLGARQRKALSNAKKEKRKAIIQGIASVAENAIMVGGGQRSMAEAREAISRNLYNARQGSARAKEVLNSVKERMEAQGLDPTAGMDKKEEEDYAKAMGMEISKDSDEVQGHNIDTDGQNVFGEGTVRDEDGAVVNKNDSFKELGEDGKIKSGAGQWKPTGKLIGNQGASVYVNSKTGEAVRPRLAGEDLTGKEHLIVRTQNNKGQTVEMVKLVNENGKSGVKMTASGNVLVPKSVMSYSGTAKVDNSFNSRRNIDAVTAMPEMANVSIENIQTATYNMEQAQAVLNEDSTNEAATAQMAKAKETLATERKNFNGDQEQFRSVVKNISVVQKVQTANYSNIASNSSVPFTAEDNKSIERYTEITRELNTNSENLSDTKKEQLREELGKIETKFETKHNVNLKSTKVRKQIVKAAKKAGNIKKNMKDIKKV